ncbi:hypothetical protein EV182_007514 [Spiromyces aspiralis]|uniref:Uncharacterized protein n=1 Tax=Spiromyces aspiralis TaxID=68401 RepID=A0ACC1HAF3_9FUNG|nr:hypothetical protein EV182_007514 [Spiromyces aspiralis]
MGLPFTFDEYNDMASEMKFKVFPFADLTPGAAKLIKHLVKHNIPIAIATSSTRHMFEIKTARNQHIFELFGENVTCGDDPNLKQSKPDPSIFLLARSRLPNPPPHEECLVFEDSNNGVCAAKRAGMNAVWVPDSRFTVQQEIDENEFNAVQVLSSLEEFDPALYGLPSYDD